MKSNLKSGLNGCLRKWVWLVLPMSVLSACNPCVRLMRRCPPVASRTDSVYVFDTLIRERLLIDTFQTIELVPQTVRVTVSATDTVCAETVYAYAMAWLDGGCIGLRMWNKDSAEALTKKIVEREKQLVERGRIRDEVHVRTVYQTPIPVKILAWIGGVLLLYLVGKALIRMVVRYNRWI